MESNKKKIPLEPEYYALAEKILKDIDNILKKYPNLSHFEIIPVDNNYENKSPVIHMENCLGLEQWCVKYVYLYCYTHIFDIYENVPKKKSEKLRFFNVEKVIMLLNLSLMINPELNNLWNKRRELVLSEHLNVLDELRFTRLVLSRKAKSNDTFAFRRWLIEIILKDDSYSSIFSIPQLMTQDLEITNRASEASPNNYHSWNHRIWFICKMSSHVDINESELYINEYLYSERICATHISDYSCFHYRQFCIANLTKVSCLQDLELKHEINLSKIFLDTLVDYSPENLDKDLANFGDETLLEFILKPIQRVCKCHSRFKLLLRNFYILFRELILNRDMILFYKGHEALWYHRRYIINKILAVTYDYHGFSKHTSKSYNYCAECDIVTLKKQPKLSNYDCIKSSLLYNVCINIERNFVCQMEKEGDNYSDRHRKYLKFIEGMTI